LQSILFALIIPFITSYITRKLVIKVKGENWFANNILSKIGFSQIIFLSLAIIAMFASQGEKLVNNPQILLKLLLPVVLFFIINLILGQIIGRILKFEDKDIISLNLTTIARNSPISLAIALTAFPDQPLIALDLIIGPLIELPVLAGVSQMLLFIHKS